MQLPRTAAIVDLVVLERTGSTNDELTARVTDAADGLTVVTDDQTEGRGRLDRGRVTPPGHGLAVSTLLRMDGDRGVALAPDRWGWIPLLAGAAMSRSLSAVLPGADVGLKWPNDVLVGGRKVCGILTEVTGGGSAIVVGAGVNLAVEERDLPTSNSTSLALEGASVRGDELADAVLSRWLTAFRDSVDVLVEHDGDVGASGIRSLVIASCSTIGRRVQVQLPAGDGFTGTAVGIDADGRLMVDRGTDRELAAVAAGDVTHLRYE